MVCISDTHSRHEYLAEVPLGDVLIHSGDCTAHGKMSQLESFVLWMSKLPHKHKILIAGNHDYCFYKRTEYSEILDGSGIIYLEDSGIEIDGVRIWGSPYSPFFRHMAFEKQRNQLANAWAQIPVDTQILITHCPPMTVLDLVDGRHVGCESLFHRLDELPELRLHVFGHIHEGYGMDIRKGDGLRFVNASSCDSIYQPVNHPVVVDLDFH